MQQLLYQKAHYGLDNLPIWCEDAATTLVVLLVLLVLELL